MKKIIMVVSLAIILFSFISAADFTPQGNITLRNVYNIQNATSITIGNGTVHINPSGFFGWLNWSWLTNIPAYVKDWDYKLNATDQRYNDTAFVISYVNLNACLSNGTNCPISVQNYWINGTYSTINTSNSQNIQVNSVLTNSILNHEINTPLNVTLNYNSSATTGFGYHLNYVSNPSTNQLSNINSWYTVKAGDRVIEGANLGGYNQWYTESQWVQLGSSNFRGGSIKIKDTNDNDLFIVDMVNNRTYLGSNNMSLYNYSMDLDVTGTSILNRLNVSGKDIYFTNPDSTNFHFAGTNGVTFYFNQLESSTLTFSDNEYGFYTAQPRGFIFHNSNVNVTQNLTVEGCLILNGTTYCSLNNAVETNSNKTIGNFVGLTSGTHTGNLTSGATSGYTAANALCNAAFTGSHICSYAELKRSMDLHISFGTETFWSTTGFPGYTANANDCLGWTDPTETYYGPFWDPTATVDYGAGYIAPCSQTKKLGCCL